MLEVAFSPVVGVAESDIPILSQGVKAIGALFSVPEEAAVGIINLVAEANGVDTESANWKDNVESPLRSAATIATLGLSPKIAKIPGKVKNKYSSIKESFRDSSVDLANKKITPPTDSFKQTMSEGKLTTAEVSKLAKDKSPVSTPDYYSIAEESKTSLAEFKKKVSENYDVQIKDIVSKYGDKSFPQVLQKTKIDTGSTLKSYNVSKAKTPTGEKLDFSKTDIAERAPGSIKLFDKMSDMINKQKEVSPPALNLLRQKLSAIANDIAGMDTKAGKIAYEMVDNLNSNLAAAVEEIGAMNKQYSADSVTYKKAAENLSEQKIGTLSGKSKGGSKAAIEEFQNKAEAMGIKSPDVITKTEAVTSQLALEKYNQSITKEQLKKASDATGKTTAELNGKIQDALMRDAEAVAWLKKAMDGKGGVALKILLKGVLKGLPATLAGGLIVWGAGKLND